MIRKSLEFGARTIEYNLQYSNRKSLGITVTPEMNVVVKAPVNASTERIARVVQKRAPWILRQQSYFLTFHPKQPPKRFVNGESHLYLGRQYRLRVRRGKREIVKLDGGHLDVVCRTKTRTKEVLKSWYVRQARLKFDLYAEEWIARFKKHDVSPTAIVLRSMARRWGSCTPTGKIVLNTELIKAPRGCIDYVIVHELCHLVQRNHTQKFIDLQTREMPGWEKRKMRLERLLA